MPKGYSFMALIQVIVITEIALGMGIIIKVRYKIGWGLDDRPPSPGRTLRDTSWSTACYKGRHHLVQIALS